MLRFRLHVLSGDVGIFVMLCIVLKKINSTFNCLIHGRICTYSVFANPTILDIDLAFLSQTQSQYLKTLKHSLVGLLLSQVYPNH